MRGPEVLLVDDNADFRRSTAWLLEAAGMQVREYGDPNDLLTDFPGGGGGWPTAKRCVVTDLRMPAMSGLELIEEMRQRRLRLPVVMVTGHGDVTLAVEAMRRGAADFLEKPFEVETLIKVIRRVVNEPGALPRNPIAVRARLDKLTPREHQVLQLVTDGKYNKTIADKLGISIKTVELHRANVVSKLGVKSVPELVRVTLGYE